ncbi:MAG: hypothetical protein MJ175_08290 [Clostridia bacterium]|nr:hypothetical protein [Clostridia bacterium]
MKVENLYRVLVQINLFADAVFCALCPPVLFALGAKWLCGRFGWNKIIIAAAVLFGVIIGFKSMSRVIGLRDKMGNHEKVSYYGKKDDDADKEN